MANLKNITDLPVVESAEGLNLIVNDNGSAKQVPASAVGGSGVADWNASEGEPGYVKNRTHYEETVTVSEPLNITWDGNTEGLVNVNNQFYKVSDVVLTDEQIKLTSVQYADLLTVMGDVWEEFLGTQIICSEEATFAMFIIVARKNEATLSANGMSIVIPESGIYFATNPGGYVSSLTTTDPIEHTKTIVHTIDKKYLPDDIGSGGGVFVVDLMYQEDSTYTTSATAEELATAYEEGKTLYANINDSLVYPLSAIYYAARVRVTFAGVNMYAGSAPFYEAFTIKNSTVTVNKFTLTEVT